jgi:hypothetical protein
MEEEDEKKIEKKKSQLLEGIPQQQEELDSALRGISVEKPDADKLDWTGNQDYQSASNYLTGFVEKYGPKALTPDEIEKRKRAAMAVQGVGALGNVANAIGNLIYVGKGAPSQTLPKNVDASAEIDKLEESERVKRNEIYQRAKDRVATAQAVAEAKAKAAQQDFSNQLAAGNFNMAKVGQQRENYLFTPKATQAINQAASSGYKALADRTMPDQAKVSLQASRNNLLTQQYNNALLNMKKAYEEARLPFYGKIVSNEVANNNPHIPIATGYSTADGQTVYVPTNIPRNNWSDAGFVSSLAGLLGIAPTYQEGSPGSVTTKAKPLSQLQAEVAAKLAEPGNAEKVAALLAEEWDGK